MTSGLDEVRGLMGQGEDVDLPEDVARASAHLRQGDDDADPDDHGHDAADDHGGGDHGGGDGGNPPDDLPPPELIREAATFPLNDIGNGRRYGLYFGEDVLWVPRVGWFVWNGRMWAVDPDRIEVRRRGQRVSGLIRAEVPHVVLSPRQMELLETQAALERERKGLEGQRGEDGKITEEAQARIDRIDAELRVIWPLQRTLADLRKGHRTFAKSAGNTGKIDAMLTEAGVALSRRLDDLDASPLMVNTESATLVFSVEGGGDSGMSKVGRVEARAHDRADLLTKSLTTAYDPAAKCPLFLAFLERILPPIEIRAFIQRWFGLSMTALTGEQKLAFFYGAGANGKSVLVDLMARIFGDYAATAKIESLIGKNRRSGGDATPDMMPLVGARMVRASEPEEGERLQEAKIKEMTGGEPMLIRALQADFFEYTPVFKLTISGNHKPDIRGTDDGIWRRVMLVPFDVQIPPAERDANLIDKLYAERAGILNWLVDGLIDYLEGGLREPEAVRAATQEYRQDSDPVGAMLTECTEVTGHPDDFLPSRTLIESIQFWQHERAIGQWGERTLSNRLKEKADRWKHPASGRMFTAAKSGTTGYRGIRLVPEFRDRFDQRPIRGPREVRE